MSKRPGPAAVPIPLPLAVFEREGLAAALAKVGLSTTGIDRTDALFWRFENANTPVPLGFGGLEIFGDQALLRSVMTLPPLRNRTIGSHIVAWLETEARIRGCRTAWIDPADAAEFFLKLDYRACEPSEAPEQVRKSDAFTPSGAAMMKRLD